MNVPTFTYAQLPPSPHSFRLLKILPSLANDSPIRCELFDSLLPGPHFIAGSYVWGPPETSDTIFLNDKSFLVRPNLKHFLRACRRRLKPRIMWIDALCINQEDNQEKSRQVRAMGRIYHTAQAVYCWLGQENTRAYKRIFDHHIWTVLWYSKIRKNASELAGSFHQLAQCEYFRRMWIVQEFILAHNIYLLAGSKKISWSRIERLLDMPEKFYGIVGPNAHYRALHHGLRNLSDSSDPNGSRMLQMRDYRLDRTNAWRWRFQQLFTTFGGMSCSIPQDRVFALFGLSEIYLDGIKLSEFVDYDLSVWQLLRELVQNYIVSGEYLLQFILFYDQNVIMGTSDEHANSLVDWTCRSMFRTAAQHRSICMNICSTLQDTEHDSCVHQLMIDERAKIWSVSEPGRSIVISSTLTSFPQPHIFVKVWSYSAMFREHWDLCLVVDECGQICRSECVGHQVLDIALLIHERKRHEVLPPARCCSDTMRSKVLFTAAITTIKSFRGTMHARERESAATEDIKYTVAADLKSLVLLAQTSHELGQIYRQNVDWRFAQLSPDQDSKPIGADQRQCKECKERKEREMANS